MRDGFWKCGCFTSVWVFENIYFDVAKLKNHNTIDLDDNVADFRYNKRANMIAHFERDFYNKSFSHQDHGKRDDVHQKGISFGLNMLLVKEDQYLKMFMIMISAMMEKPIFFRGAKYNPEFKELEKILTINHSENK